MAKLGFKKGSSFSSYEAGILYFETSTHLLKVGTGADTCEIYSGVRSASWNSTNKVLTIVDQTGSNIELDFADVASAQGVNSLLAGLRDDINSKLDKPTVDGSIGQVLRVKDASGNVEWFTIPGATNYSVTIDSSEAGTVDGYLKSYHISQNGSEIGVINIPKDLVVTQGSVVTGTWSNDIFTEGANGTGKAIKLIVANQTDPLYINVADLVDDISIIEGATNGTISVNGTDVTVHGLGSAAYTDSTAYDSSGAAATVQSTLIGASTDASTADTIYGAKAYADEVAGNAIQGVTGETATTDSSYIEISVEASINGSNEVTLSSHANVTTHDVSTATDASDGLATAYDVKQYVANAHEWLEFN